MAKTVRDFTGVDGVLILVDLLGASPFNVSAALMENNPRVQVVTGVNLPMLLETVTQREYLPLAELTNLARQAGTDRDSIPG